VLGGFVMFFSEKLNIHRVLPLVLLASGTFGLVNVMQKVAFDRTNFVSGYVFFTFGTFVGALLMLVPASWRKQILETSEKAEPRSRFWYFANRFIAGVGSFLTFYAISLTAPAIVDAITGVRYVIIFAGAYGITKLRPSWLREDFTGFALLAKTAATLLVVAGLVLLGLKNGGEGDVSSSLLLSPRSIRSPLQEHDSTCNQDRCCPTPQPHVFLEHVFGKKCLQQVANGPGRDRETHIRNGKQ
jgi:drug/metabolite transporter (DMT)-like permease